MKTPPDRSGITFEVGAQLEARDRHKNWYTATIEKIDYDKEQVLIHYRQWSRRHDEWFQWSSPYLRPLERVSLRRQGLNAPAPIFVSGSKVMACWTDCRFYPAKILRVNKDDSYTVRFFDGVVRTVKSTKIKPADEKDRCDKGAVGSEGWEEGDSEEEEEQGGPREEEEEKKEAEAEEGEEMSGKEEEEEDRKRKAEPSSTQTPVKKKPDESRSSGAPGQPIRADYTVLACSNPAHMDKDVLLERQAHLPTTNKYSREPLYRVIKNQPPPILSIELDHNPFKCLAVGCTKSFRKASLLHYHIKYYHSEQQAEPRAGPRAGPRAEPPPNRRKRSSSEGDDFLLNRTMENSSCNHGDGEQGAMATEVKKDGGRKQRRHVLRDKLKKRKKKKKKKKSPSGLGSSDDENGVRPSLTLKLNTRPVDPHPPADDGSDWSTLTAESGEDTPSWLVAMETQERCEVVRCVCEVDEENDFMIQCESCQCWQHGTCMGLYEDSVPQNYTCYYCRHTTGWRRAHRFRPELDWLSSGQMFGLSCVKDNYFDTNSSTVCHTHRLLAHTHSLGHVISGLRLKVSLLHSPSHPDLRLWRLPWRWQEEGLRVMGGGGLRGDMTVSYVSSEHCYQKPGASWEKSEKEVDPKMEDVQQEDTPRDTDPKTEDVQQEDTPTDTDPKTEDAQQEDTPSDAHRDGKTHPQRHPQLSTAERKAECEVECQLNLLEHIEELHQQISDRMDQMDKELDVLESWLDHSGELQPPDPLSRLPQLKQRIRRLLCDLCTVRSLSVCR